MNEAVPGAPTLSQTDRAIVALRDLILQGVFSAGDRLTELALASRLGASRTPVRHALARLADQGLLDALPGGGFRVRSFCLQEVWDAIELRGVLEGMAARLAAERLTSPAALAPMRVLLPEMDDALARPDFSRYFTLNELFHLEMRTLAGSLPLSRMIEALFKLPFAAPTPLNVNPVASPEAWRLARICHEEHHAIVDCIAARAGLRAEALVREHVLVWRQSLQLVLADRAHFARLPGASLLLVPSESLA